MTELDEDGVVEVAGDAAGQLGVVGGVQFEQAQLVLLAHQLVRQRG